MRLACVHVCRRNNARGCASRGSDGRELATGRRRRSLPLRYGCSGFSLIEGIVVLVIVSVAAAAAFWRYPDPRSQDARVARDDLWALLRYAQNLAVCRHRFVRVEWDTNANTWAVFLATNHPPTGYAPAVDPMRQAAWFVRLSDEYPNVRLRKADFDGWPAVLFCPTNGRPCRPDGIPLQGTGTVEFASGQRVELLPLTGYVLPF